jgi:ATP-dependent 26S proteasome regulatory subunit
MEPAILRAGRLCRRLEVGCLTPKEGTAVFSRLLPEMKEIPSKLTNAKEVSLAEVYSIARNSGWSPEARETKEDIVVDSIDDDEGEDE